MAKPLKHEVRLAAAAKRDLSGVMEWTVNEFGERAALRCDALIKQALKDIWENPGLVGSKERPEMMIEGARTYHLQFSKNRVSGPSVKHPRHFILYRCLENGPVDVARILHDGRDLQRHMPADYNAI